MCFNASFNLSESSNRIRIETANIFFTNQFFLYLSESSNRIRIETIA